MLNFLTILFLFFSFNIYADFKQKLKDAVFDETYKNDLNFQRHKLSIEGGFFYQSINKIGTDKFSDKLNLLSIDNKINPYWRISYYFNLDKKNSFRILYAPFSISGNGIANSSGIYEGLNYDSNNFTAYSYMFNSYRFTYIRTIFHNEFFQFQLGLTAKIRDAKITLLTNNQISVDKDFGFVPLLYFNGEYRINNFVFQLEGDFAASKFGRAIDISFKSMYEINKHLDFGFGYRFLEGGANTKTVFNNILVHYFFTTIDLKI